MTELIYLASASPRRRELLEQLNIPVEVITAPIDETLRSGESAAVYTLRMAEQKACAGWRQVQSRHKPQQLLVAADTTVALHGVLLGKPEDEEDARRMLTLLSGSTHEVVTSVTVINLQGEINSVTSVSQVKFCALSEQSIQAYLQTGEPFDKAGAYAVQGKAAMFIEHIQGSFSGIVGLPLFETAQLLQQQNYVFFK